MTSFAERFPILKRCGAYVDAYEPRRFGRMGWSVVALLVLIAGLPSLWAPFDGDQALFFVSGQKILNGDVLYRDIVDLKPPLIYFIYAGAIGLFGESLLAVRLAELLVQLLVVVVIVKTVRRTSNGDAFAALAGLMYAALYFSLPYYCKGQVEGFASLPIVLILSLTLDRTNRGRNRRELLIGILIGLLILLKTSLAAMLLPAVFFLLTDKGITWKRRIGEIMTIGLGLVIPLALMLVYFWAFEALGDMVLVQTFTQGYATEQWKSLSTPIVLAIRQVPWYFVTTYSVMLALLTVGGMALVLFPRGSDATFSLHGNERMAVGIRVEGLLRFSLVAFLLLLATVVVEAKYLTWHFNRLLVFGAVLAAWGAIAFLRRVLSATINRFTLSIIVLSLPPLFLFTPLLRYAWNNAAYVAHAAQGTEGFGKFVGMEDNDFDLMELEKVGRYIRDHREPDGKLFTASGWGGAIHYYAGDIPDFKIYHSCFLIAPYAPDEWRRETVRYLTIAKPQFIVAQHDAMPHITGNQVTSFEMLHSLPGIDSLLQTRYRIALDTKMTVVYESIGGQ